MTQDILNHQLLKTRGQRTLDVLKKFEQENLNPNAFCIMPFVNIILEPNGNIGLCRHKGTESSLGNIKENTISEIWNGEEAKAWREEFLQGKVRTCAQEIKHQKCNLCPELNRMFSDVQLTSHQDKFLRLTANLNGFCNLECQMCDVWQLPNHFYQEDNFWGPARKDIFPYLKEIDMLSGEPFLQKDTYKLIDEVARVNPDCLWSITTNAHWKLNTAIQKKLDLIKIKNIILSVDSFTPEIYAKIRKKGTLAKVLENIERLLTYEQERLAEHKSALNLNLNFLVQKDNWHEVKNAIDYCLARNITPFITFCYRPSEHSLLTLSLAERKNILETYLDHLSWDYLTLTMRVIRPVLDSLPSIDKIIFLERLEQLKSVYSAN